MDFFGMPKRRPRVQCHVDGISIPGVGSMRVSNIPNNLWKVGNLLLTLGQKPALFYGFIAGILGIRGDDQCGAIDRLSYSSIYMNHSQRNSFLSIQYAPALIDFGTINSICNFSIAEEQPVTYEKMGCFCPVIVESYRNIVVTATSILFFGNNVTAESANCIRNFLETNCLSLSTPAGLAIMIVVVIAFGGIVMITSGCCLYYFCKKTPETVSEIASEIANANNRGEETRLLTSINLSKLKQRSFNSLLDEDPPADPPSENNRWCCFRR